MATLRGSLACLSRPNAARPILVALEKFDLLPALPRVRFVRPFGWHWWGRDNRSRQLRDGKTNRHGSPMKETQGSEKDYRLLHRNSSAHRNACIDPVIVSDVIPVGAVMVSVVEEVPLAITTLGGTTPLGLLDRETLVS